MRRVAIGGVLADELADHESFDFNDLMAGAVNAQNAAPPPSFQSLMGQSLRYTEEPAVSTSYMASSVKK